MTPVLLPLYVSPTVDPAAWQAVAACGGLGAGSYCPPATPAEPSLCPPTTPTVVVEDLELTGPAGEPGPAGQLAAAGVTVLGRVDAGFATRPVADLLDDVAYWAERPVSGIFLDPAPTSPFSLGPVALAIRVARRAGLATVVLNPGVPTDPLYRDLRAPICTFEGSWLEYRRWSGEGSHPGDGHLVHSVPAGSLAAAQALLAERRAGWGLVTDLTPPAPYAGLPSWLPDLVPARS